MPVDIKDQKLTIEYEDLEEPKFQQIIWFPARNHEVGWDEGWRSWKYFIKGIYGPKIRTVTLETGVALFVKSLSASGITATSSCDEYGKRSPYISFFRPYNANWFMVLYKNLMQNFDLNYDWKIEINDGSNPNLIAKSRWGIWDLRLVLEDTYQMSRILLPNARRIPEVKRELFRAKRNNTWKHVKAMTVGELTGWIENKFLTLGGSKNGSSII